MWYRGCSVCLCLLWIMHNTSELPLTTLPPRTKTTAARSSPTRRPTTRHILSSLKPTSRRKTAPSRTSRRSTVPRRTLRLTTLPRGRRTKTPVLFTTRRPKLSTRPSRTPTTKFTKVTPPKKRPGTGSPLGDDNPTKPTEGQIHRCPCVQPMKKMNSTKLVPLQSMEINEADLCPCHSDMGAKPLGKTTLTASDLPAPQSLNSNPQASASQVAALPPSTSQQVAPPPGQPQPTATQPSLSQQPPPPAPLPPPAPVQPPLPAPAQPQPLAIVQPPLPAPGQPPPPQQTPAQTSPSSYCPCNSQIEIYETTAICPCDESHSQPPPQQQQLQAQDSRHQQLQQAQTQQEQQPESGTQQQQQKPVSVQQEAKQQPQKQQPQQTEGISPDVASHFNNIQPSANCPCTTGKNTPLGGCPCQGKLLVPPMLEHCQCRGSAGNELEQSNCSCAYVPLKVKPGVCQCEGQRESPKCHCADKEQWTPGCQCTSHISSPVSPSCTCHSQDGGSHQGHPFPTIPPECLCHPSDMNNCFCDF